MIDTSKEKLVKRKHVAERFGVHERTVDGWFAAGLEHTRVGRLLFTSEEAITRFQLDNCNLGSNDREARERALKREMEIFEARVKRRFKL